jgi:hypothetical protein
MSKDDARLLFLLDQLSEALRKFLQAKRMSTGRRLARELQVLANEILDLLGQEIGGAP